MAADSSYNNIGKDLWDSLLQEDIAKVEKLIAASLPKITEVLVYEDSTNGHETSTCIQLLVNKSGERWSISFFHFYFSL